jgi:hypothetical protein
MNKSISLKNRQTDIDRLQGQEVYTSGVGSSNNHIDTLLFSNLSIFKHVHVVRVSFIDVNGEGHLVGMLDAIGFKMVSKLKLYKGNYGFKSSYKNDNSVVKVDVIHQLKSQSDRLPPFLLIVHDPTREFIDVLDNVCKHWGLQGKVSNIELAFDFYTEKVWDVFAFLRSSLFMRYQRSRSSEQYDTTYYANHLKHSSRGLKTYFRGGRGFVRLELTLKRAVIKKLRIDMSLKAVDEIDPLDYFTFMRLDEVRLKDYFIWQSRDEIASLESGWKWDGDLARYQIGSYLRNNHLAPESLMGKIDVLKSKDKGIQNYSRFLFPLDDFIEKFKREIERQSFVPRRLYQENVLKGNSQYRSKHLGERDAAKLIKHERRYRYV